MWSIVLLVILLLIIIIIVLLISSSSVTYYPAVNIGNGGAATPTPANSGVCRVAINSTATYSVPTGYVFIGNWTFGANSGVTLSNNSQTATIANPSMNQAILVGTTALTGKTMISYTTTWPGYSESIGVGVCSGTFNAVATNNGGNYLGYNSQAFALYDDGYQYSNGDTIATNGPRFEKTNGTNVVDMCVDVPNKLVWLRVDNGPWNAVAGTDPALSSSTVTGGGLSLSCVTN